MKILYSALGTCTPGGMERVLAGKANWLVAHGHQVTIATTDQRAREPFYRIDARVKCVDLGINYEENNGAPIVKKALQYPLKQHRHKVRLMALLRHERPDVTVSMFNNDVDFIAGLDDGSKKVLEIHFTREKRLLYRRRGVWGLADRIRYTREADLVKRFDRFVVLTHDDAKAWGEIPTLRVIPNACTLVPQEMAALDALKAVAIGRLSFEKGFDSLIRAWSLLGDDCDGWRLDIVGEGPEEEKLRRLIAELGLEARVFLRPATQEIDRVYRGSSLLALTSRYEGFPMVLVEAHTFGIPTVAFDCKYGPRNIVADGRNGFLVEPGNLAMLARRLRELMLSKELRLRMGANAATESRRYSQENVMQQWEHLFRALLKNGESKKRN